MTYARAIVTALLFAGVFTAALHAEEPPGWRLEPTNPQGWAEYDPVNHVFSGTNGVRFTYSGAVLTADSLTMDEKSGEVFADGGVRIQREEQVWVGEHIVYNYHTRQMEARQFRTGKPPVFVAGEGLHGEVINTNQSRFNPTNLLFRATNSFMTIDDISEPDVKIRAKSITIMPGRKLIARHATL